MDNDDRTRRRKRAERMGARLRKARIARRLTQAQVGRLVGMTGASVCRIEAGGWELAALDLQAWCDALDLAIEDL